MSDDILFVAVAIIYKENNGRKTLTRSKWKKENWLLKKIFLRHTNLLRKLRLELGDWFNYLRMAEATY
jgi:hypothetical protein